jgi:hypothetical protein
VGIIQQYDAIELQLDQIMANFTSPSNALTLTLNQKTIQISNSIASQMNSALPTGNSSNPASFDVGSYCDLMKESLANSGQNTTGFNCSLVTFVQKTAVSQIAASGSNGASSNVGTSQLVTVSFFQSNSQGLNVQGLSTPISVWIPRSSNGTIPSYQSLTASYAATLQCSNNDFFFQNTFTISTDSSIHIQFKPTSANAYVGYLMLLKFGRIPQLTSSSSIYDYWQLYCPSDTSTQLGDTFFLFFANQTRVNKFTGNVNIAVRELTSSELSIYCPGNVNSYNATTPPILTSYSSSSSGSSSSNGTSNSTGGGGGCKAITNDLNLRVFLSGCYYLDPITAAYTSDGTVVQPDTTLVSTHCLVYHCTDFAGGFVVAPTAINFDKVFSSEASIANNPTLYATVFTIIGLYVILAVMCRYLDYRDNKKKGVTMMNEGRTENLYEVIVFTGSRKSASTESNVHIYFLIIFNYLQ